MNTLTGPVAIYARFSSALQSERSVDDQVRRCREYVAQHGSDPEAVKVFADFAISGASLERPGFEAMMAAVNKGTIKAIVTEDLSRISRDFADSAMIFKKLQFKQVPLIGVADGIDTSMVGAKMAFTFKSLMSEMYLDDLRYKTLRGLEGRALQGYATGNVAFGFHTVPVTNDRGEVLGNKIEIHEAEAKIIRRIFRESRDGRSLTTIAHGLNSDSIPSPRVGTRHTRFGWGSSTIRAMLYNERYIGVWKFKERQWVKVPGTNRRQPRARNAADVMQQLRPELAILDRDLWDDVQQRLAQTKKRYTEHGGMRGELTYKRAPYLLSGLLICRACGAPMTMMGSDRYRYYRCQANKTKGPQVCKNERSLREDIVRPQILDEIRARLLSPDGALEVRRRVAKQLGDRSKQLDSDLRERRERLARTKEKMAGLVDYIAGGDRSPYIVKTLHDHEAFSNAEQREIEILEEEARTPISLPSPEQVERVVREFDAHLKSHPEAAREQMRSWIQGGTIRVGPREDGEIVAEGDLLPMFVVESAQTPKRQLPVTKSMVTGRYTTVAGVGFEPTTFGL